MLPNFRNYARPYARFTKLSTFTKIQAMKNGAVITPHPKLLLTAVKIKTMNKILLIPNITLHIIYKTIDRKNSVDHTCISSPAKIINISMHQAAREKK